MTFSDLAPWDEALRQFWIASTNHDLAYRDIEFFRGKNDAFVIYAMGRQRRAFIAMTMWRDQYSEAVKP